jgi:hypothetical protein
MDGLNDLTIQGIGVIVASAGVIASSWVTVKGQKQDKTISEATAARSEAAARISADNAQRIVAALEALATKDFAGGGVVMPPATVRWGLVHEHGSLYRLTNTGDAPAWRVEVTTDPSLRLMSSNPDHSPTVSADQLRPGEALTFIAAPSMATRDTTITVSWLDDETGERRDWRYPLPMKPK